MPRPRTDIRARILAAARARFVAAGVDGSPLRRIAADARTSIGMVYYYFPTKDDLFLAVVEEMYVKVLADMTKALEPDLPVKDRLRRLYERFGAVSDEVGGLPALFGQVAKRHARQFAQCSCIPKHDRLRPHRCRRQPVEHAELAKDARCVGGKLDAGASRFEARRLFEQLYRIAALGER